jgi:hypothetical protein
MTRNGDGKIELSPSVLGIIISACLAVGSGGAFYASRASADGPYTYEQAKVAAAMVETELNAHRNQDDARDAVQNEQIRQLTERLARIEATLDKIYARLEGR